MHDDFVELGVPGAGMLLYARCCTSLSDEEAERRMNSVHPTGISSRWTLCTEPEKVPVECADDPTRRHLMFSC